MTMQQISQQDFYDLSLLDVFKFIWKNRYTIITVTLITLFLSGFYYFNSQPVYEAQAQIAPPNDINFSNINLGALHSEGNGLNLFDINTIYSYFQRSLFSNDAKQSFFSTVDQYYYKNLGPQNSYDDVYKKLSKFISISDLTNGNKTNSQISTAHTSYKVSIEAHSPEHAKKLLQEFLEIVNSISFDNFSHDIKNQIDTKISYLESEIKYVKNLSHNIREDKINLLSNSLKEAKAGNITNYIGTGIINSHFEDFMIGTKILDERLNILKQSDIDESLKFKLRVLESDLRFYSNLKPFLKPFKFYHLDGTVISSNVPISPKLSMFLFLGLLIGVFLGVIVAAINSQFKYWKRFNFDSKAKDCSLVAN
jgi:chain length determinant protein (polysaccharide antigen chain regulator)